MISRYVSTILCEMNMKGTIVLYGLFTDLIIFFNQGHQVKRNQLCNSISTPPPFRMKKSSNVNWKFLTSSYRYFFPHFLVSAKTWKNYELHWQKSTTTQRRESGLPYLHGVFLFLRICLETNYTTWIVLLAMCLMISFLCLINLTVWSFSEECKFESIL